MRRLLGAWAIALVASLVSTAGAGGQTPTPSPAPTSAPEGVISGTVKNGTSGVTGVDGVRVQLLALSGDGQVASQEATVQGGAFRFAVPATSTATYVLRATYQGVAYLVDPPILLSPEIRSERREVTVYETTSERPALTIESTVMSLQALDRELGRATLQREDQVVNPSDRIYVGSDDRVSLRIPAPDRVIEIGPADEIDAEVTLEGGVVTTTQAIRPGPNLVVTRYLVEYDQAADSYRLRVTAPLPTSEMQIWTPDEFIEDVDGDGDTTKTTRAFQGTDWTVVRRSGTVAEGESLVATIRGLTQANESNPLTEMPGAALGGALAIAILLGGLFVASRLRGSER